MGFLTTMKCSETWSYSTAPWGGLLHCKSWNSAQCHMHSLEEVELELRSKFSHSHFSILSAIPDVAFLSRVFIFPLAAYWNHYESTDFWFPAPKMLTLILRAAKASGFL